MRFQLALFDWNGTLFNDINITYATTAHLFKQLAPEASVPTLEEYRHEFSPGEMMECYYQRGVPRTLTEAAIYELWGNHYDSICNGDTRLHRGGHRLLNLLHTYEVRKGLVSAAGEGNIKHLQRLRIAHHFEKIVFDARSKEMAIRNVLDQCNVQPEHAFYVDDTVEGLAQARLAGVTTIGFTEGYNLAERIRQAKPDYVISELMEVIEIYRRHAAYVM